MDTAERRREGQTLQQQSDNSHRLAEPHTQDSIALGGPRPGQDEAIHPRMQVQNGKQLQSCSFTWEDDACRACSTQGPLLKTSMRQALSVKRAWRSCHGHNLSYSRRSVSGEDQLRQGHWFIKKGDSQRDNTQVWLDIQGCSSLTATCAKRTTGTEVIPGNQPAFCSSDI